MIRHLVLFKLVPDIGPERVEWMMRETRIQLLKIPEVLAVQCGQRIDPTNEWDFFLSVDVETQEKLSTYRDDPIHLKYVADVIRPHTTDRLALDYETSPGRDPIYS